VLEESLRGDAGLGGIGRRQNNVTVSNNSKKQLSIYFYVSQKFLRFKE
jgi:hypothetical protein